MIRVISKWYVLFLLCSGTLFAQQPEEIVTEHSLEADWIEFQAFITEIVTEHSLEADWIEFQAFITEQVTNTLKYTIEYLGFEADDFLSIDEMSGFINFWAPVALEAELAISQPSDTENPPQDQPDPVEEPLVHGEVEVEVVDSPIEGMDHCVAICEDTQRLPGAFRWMVFDHCEGTKSCVLDRAAMAVAGCPSVGENSEFVIEGRCAEITNKQCTAKCTCYSAPPFVSGVRFDISFSWADAGDSSTAQTPAWDKCSSVCRGRGWDAGSASAPAGDFSTNCYTVGPAPEEPEELDQQQPVP